MTPLSSFLFCELSVVDLSENFSADYHCYLRHNLSLEGTTFKA